MHALVVDFFKGSQEERREKRREDSALEAAGLKDMSEEHSQGHETCDHVTAPLRR